MHLDLPWQGTEEKASVAAEAFSLSWAALHAY
jgi:hypothetical protein